MRLFKGLGEFFAMDIGTNSIRIVQLDGDIQHGWVLEKYKYMPMDAKIAQDDSELGRKKYGSLIKQAVNEAGITTKNIVVGFPAQRTFTAIVETENAPVKEILKTMEYRVDQYIPMAVEEAKVDLVCLGTSPNDPEKAEVLISSTLNKFAESQLDFIEGLGYNVVAFEPEPLAMARSLVPIGATDAQMMVDLGEKSADIVISYKGAPRLVRSIAGGFESMLKTVAGALDVRDDQARQFVLKFGLAQDKVDGQVFRALSPILETFASELIKSAKFFQSKYVDSKMGGIVLSGFAEIIPFVAEYIEAKTSISTTHGNPWQAVRVTPDQQRELVNVASEFAVAIGLAERSNANV